MRDDSEIRLSGLVGAWSPRKSSESSTRKESPWGISEGVGQLQSGTFPNPVLLLTNPAIMITP